MVSRVAQLSAIHTEIYHCTKCALHEGRTRTVPGAGHPDAEIMFIGEAPGYNEDKQGLPFVGKSGKYLEELLATINLTRDDVFIANIIKCRPPDNADPLESQIEACQPYIQAQIKALDPLLIVTLGRFSMAMFFPNEKVSRIHGNAKYDTHRAYYPLYHPAYALRNKSKKVEMVEDFARIPRLLDKIREKRQSALIDEISTAKTKDDDAPTQKGLFN